jgi:pyruvate,orthophosphate dikinase
MFFAEERILRVREMILARNEDGRRKAIDQLLPFQKGDFEGIFRELPGMPVTIRLLDPPLHEFPPHTESQISAVARDGMGDSSNFARRSISCTSRIRC